MVKFLFHINLNCKVLICKRCSGIEKDINKVQLKDIPKQAKIKIGDTIVTGGNSLIFPKGILIGYIQSFKLDNSENYLELEINLSTDMTNIENLYIINK